MKKILLCLLLLNFFKSSYCQEGITSLPSLSQYKLIDLRGVSGIAVDDTGRVWMSCSGLFLGGKYISSPLGLLTIGSDSAWNTINLDSLGGPNTKYLSSIQYKNGALWMGSNKGLIRKKGNSWALFSKPSISNTEDTVNNFKIEGNTYYLATQTGIKICYSQLGKKLWKVYDTSNSSLPTQEIFALDKDKKGVFWLATRMGVVSFNPKTNESKIYNRNNSEFWTDTILSIKVLPNDEVWAGCLSKYNGNQDYYPGLFHYNGNTFENLISKVGYCGMGPIPNCSFYQITAIGNDIVFPSSFSVYYSLNAWFIVHESTLKRIEIPVPFYRVSKTLMAQYNNKQYCFQGNYGIGAFIIEPDKIVSDSGYYWYKHPKDSVGSFTNNEASAQLNVNNLIAPLSIEGDLFNMDRESEQHFCSKNTLCKTISYAGSLWMGGVSDGNLYLSAGTYRQSGIDFSSGPLRIGNASSSLNTRLAFSKIFKTEERVLNEFKQSYTKPGYIVPEQIKNWPAHGDSMNGFAPNLAPFVDVNKNGKYEPQLGDYPNTKGQQSFFWIFNDSTLHSESEGRPLGIEVQAQAYAYVCDKITDADSTRAVNNTIFLKYKLINRSQRTYTDFNAGFWLDCFLGTFNSTRIGSNPKEGYAYLYKADSIDKSFAGYGTKLPACALVLLKGFKDSSGITKGAARMVSYVNDFSIIGNPSRPEHYNNYLKGKWKDGAAITYGNMGRGGNDSQEVWMFPSVNDKLGRSEWTEEIAGKPLSDSKFVLSTYNITLKPNEEQEIEFAIVYSPTETNKRDLILQQLNKDVVNVKRWYANQNFPSCSTIPLGVSEKIFEQKTQTLKIYPNPSSAVIHLELSNEKPIQEVQLIDITGKLVYTTQGQNIKQVDLSAFPSGMYFIKVGSEGKFSVQKLIKN